VLVATHPFNGSFAAISDWKQSLFGRSAWKAAVGTDSERDEDFEGRMDEIRVWSVARNAAQIRETMFQRLTGQEAGLVGLWNFDDPGDPGKDLSSAGHDAKLIGNARTIAAEVPPSSPSFRVEHVLDLDGTN